MKTDPRAVWTRNLQDTCWLVGLLLVGFVVIPGAIVWAIVEAWRALGWAWRWGMAWVYPSPV